jgi:hypothetical protein
MHRGGSATALNCPMRCFRTRHQRQPDHLPGRPEDKARLRFFVQPPLREQIQYTVKALAEELAFVKGA